MTSLLTTAALTPLILALVPCLFLTAKPGVSPDPPRLQVREDAPARSDRTPWSKPTALGVDNYS